MAGAPQGYFGLATTKRPLKKKPPPRRPGGGGPPPFNEDEWINTQVEKDLEIQREAVREQQRLYLAELQRQAQERVKAGQALAAWLQQQNFPGAIQGVFGSAADDVAGYAKGFAGNIRDIASADAAQQQRMLSGTGQEGAVRNEGEGMGDVLYGAYGWSPAKSLSEQGAAFGADAAMQPAFAGRQAAADASRMQQEGLGQLTEFAKMITEINLQKPEIADQIKQRRLEAKQYKTDEMWRKRKYVMDRLEQERDWFLQQAAIADRMGDNKRSEEYLRLANEREQRMIMQSKGYAADGTLLPDYKMLPNGTVVKKTKPKASSAPKGPDWGDIQKDIASEDLTKEVIDPNRPWLGEVETKMEYKEAFKFLWSKYSGLVKNRGRLRKLINEILAAKGIFPPKKKGPSYPSGSREPGARDDPSDR